MTCNRLTEAFPSPFWFDNTCGRGDCLEIDNDIPKISFRGEKRIDIAHQCGVPITHKLLQNKYNHATGPRAICPGQTEETIDTKWGFSQIVNGTEVIQLFGSPYS